MDTLPAGVTRVTETVYQVRTPMDILYVNAHLVVGERLALVDAGLPGTAAQVQAALTALGYGPESLRFVVITHGHPDHIGSCAQLRAASRPLLVAPLGAKPWIEDHARQLAEYPGAHPEAYPIDEEFATYWLSLMDGETPVDVTIDDPLHLDLGRGVALEAVPLAGHNAHETGYLEPATRTLILGDAIALDLPQGFPAYEDPVAYRASLQLIDDLVRRGRVERVVAGHFPVMVGAEARELVARSLRRVDKIEAAVCTALAASPAGLTLRQAGERVAGELGLSYTFQTPHTLLGHLRDLSSRGLAMQARPHWHAKGAA